MCHLSATKTFLERFNTSYIFQDQTPTLDLELSELFPSECRETECVTEHDDTDSAASSEQVNSLKNQVHIHQTPEILMPPGAYFIPKFTYAIGVKKKKFFGVTQKIRQKS